MFSSVSRALAILQFLSLQEGGVSASEIATGTDTEKSAVSRILATLENEKYIVRGHGNLYFIGLKFVSMGILQLEVTGLFQLCLPILQKIADASGELVQLAIADAEGLHYIAKADGKERVRVEPRLGTRAPLHATAVGKIWLASLPEESALKIALTAGLEAHTPNTITSIERLSKELRRVRRDGFAFNSQELFIGVNGIAVPVMGRNESIVTGAIVIVAPAFRMDARRAVSLLPLMREQAEQLRGVECLRRNGELAMPVSLRSAYDRMKRAS
jgi:DNA-binding IclR family transcriptional regulator